MSGKRSKQRVDAGAVDAVSVYNSGVDERSEWTGEKIRNVELPRAYLGGLDETSTREVLAKLAASVDESVVERHALAQRVKELEAALDEREPEVVPEGYTEQALSQLIRDARQKFDDLLQQANDEAATVKAAAATEAEQLLEDAQGDLQKTAGLSGRAAPADSGHQQSIDSDAGDCTSDPSKSSLVAFHLLPDDLVEDLWPTVDANTAEPESSQASDDGHELAEVQSTGAEDPDSENQNH